MQLAKRSDVTLLVGFAIAALVTLQGPLGDFLQRGREIEEQYGLALIPGLAILISVLLAHTLMARFSRVASQRRQADLTSVLALGQALAHAASRQTIRDVLRHKLPAVAETDDVWVVILEGGQWNAVTAGTVGGPPRVTPRIESIVTTLDESMSDPREGYHAKLVGGYLCVPIVVGDSLAVLGVAHDADRDSPDRRLRLVAAATSIGMALRHVQLLVEMEEQGVIDGLTGCFNRTHGMKMLDTELKRARRARTSLAVAMIDLDHFKSVNDRFGHLCGDALLTAVGKKLHEMLRNSDGKCRYGGEEFLILLPDTPPEGALHVGSMLRREIERVSVEWEGHIVSTTASIGIALAHPGELDPKAVVGRADEALYRAKHAGRNQVCIDGVDDLDAQAAGPVAQADSAEPAPPEVQGRRGDVTAQAS